MHPEMSLIAFGGSNDQSMVWDYVQNQVVAQLESHQDSVSSVKWSSDGTLLASGGMDGRILISQLSVSGETGEIAFEQKGWLEGPDELVWMEWHPAGPVLLAGSNDGTVWLWHVPSMAVMHVLSMHGQPCTAGQFIPSGKSLLTISSDPHLIHWDPKSGKPLWKLDLHHPFQPTEQLTTLACSKTSEVCAVGDAEGRIYIIHLTSGKLVKAMHQHQEPVESIIFSPSVQPFSWFATCSMDGRVIIWDSNTLEPRTVLVHPDGVMAMKVLNQTEILSVCVDRCAYKYDVRSGQLMGKFEGISETPLSTDFRQGKLVVGDDAGDVSLFEIQQ